MRGIDLSIVDPLRVRSLSLRKRSLLRKFSRSSGSNLSQAADSVASEGSSTAHRYVQFVKPKPPKQQQRSRKSARRVVRFAPMVDVYETDLPDDFTEQELAALWMSLEDYEKTKREFGESILAIQELDFDSSELMQDENELPPDHPFRTHCVRGCEKYFDLETRFRIRQVIVAQVLKFQKERPKDPEALRAFSRALSAECSDLAHFHGKLNSLQCWGSTLEKYRRIQNGVFRQVLKSPLPRHDESANPSGIEVVLDPSVTKGSRILSSLETCSMFGSLTACLG